MASEITQIIDPDAGGGYDYTTFAAYDDGYAKDLTTADEISIAELRPTGATIHGYYDFDNASWVTDSTRYIKLTAAAANRHAGIYDNTKALVEGSRAAGVMRILITVDMKIEDLIWHNTRQDSTSATCIYSAEPCIVAISECVIEAGATGGGIRINDSGASWDLWNCTVINDQGPGGADEGIYFDNGVTHRAFNCTIRGFTSGIERDAGTAIVTNCIAYENTDDFEGTITILTCGSDDGDGTDPQAPLDGNWANEFTDHVNHDYSLKSGGNMVGKGTDNPGSGLYSDDIINVARSSTWDIGAFEFVAVGGVAPTSVLSGPLVGPLGGPI